MAADPTDTTERSADAGDNPDAAPTATLSRWRRGPRRYLSRFNSTGLVIALLFYWISLTPSLIPRSWVFQGAITGISAAVGYGSGVLLHWTFVKAGVRIAWPARTRRIAWLTLAGAAVIAVPTAVLLGVYWQGQVRQLFGMPPAGSAHGIAIVLTALLVALVLLQLFRGLRWIARWLTGWIDRVVPKPVARLVSVLVVAVVAVLLVTNVIWAGVLNLLNDTYSAANAEFDPAVVQPTEAERSGSPQSPESWESIGAAGRTFVAGGPSTDQLRAFAATGTVVDPADVREPIRAGRGDHHRHRLARPGHGRFAGVHARREHRHRHHAVLVLAVLDQLRR